MSDKSVIILCEGEKDYRFARAYLMKIGYKERDIRRNTSPKGKGDAHNYVEKNYCKEVSAIRKVRDKGIQKKRGLVVIMDADMDKHAKCEQHIVERSKNSIENKCPRKNNERIAIFIPTRHLEAWIYYIESGNKPDYLEDYKRKKITTMLPNKAAEKLYNEICQNPKTNFASMPVSLQLACKELERIK